MWRILSYLRRQIAEIDGDPILRWYGAALSLVIPVSYLFMRAKSERIASGIDTVVCWPFFPACELHPLRNGGSTLMQGFWVLVLFLSFSSIAAFAGRRTAYAYACLALTYLLKGFLQISDYAFMGNYHYMPYVLVAGYLLVSPKLTYLKIQIVLFYIFAGILKINPEWVAGAAIPDRIPGLSESAFQILSFSVLWLELVAIWLVLNQSAAMRVVALGLLAAFHIFSFQIVGYFYPTVMALLLSVFALEFYFGQRPLTLKSHSRSLKIAVGTFLVAQLVPILSGRDTALFTHWRLSSLNMFDAAVRCEAGIYVRRKTETIEYIPNYRISMAIRTRCDPIVYREVARRLCGENAWDPQFQTIDLLLSARRATDTTFTPILQEMDVCRRMGS